MTKIRSRALLLCVLFGSLVYLADGQTPAYSGARSGTFECSGGPIPQNAEYVFRDVPVVKMRLDYDQKSWETRFAPGDGKTQRLIVKNIANGPQKTCKVHWTVIE